MVVEKDIDLKVIVFQLKDEEYAIPVKQVGSIERIQHITRVPQTEAFVKGVINLRGVVTPIIDLRKKFGMEKAIPTDSTRIIIVHTKKLEVGLIVDAAYDVIDIPEEALEPAPEVIGSADAVYIEGVANFEKRLLILLNMERVLSKQDLNQQETLEA